MELAKNEREKLDEIIQSAISRLGEHFDSIQIICTKRDGNKTALHHYGIGDWYARYGAVQYFLKRQDGIAEAEAEIDVNKNETNNNPF